MAGLLKAASKLSKARELAKRIARDKAIKKKSNEKLLSTQTGAGRGKFERGNPPAPKPVEGMAMGTKGGSAKDCPAFETGDRPRTRYARGAHAQK